MTEPVQCEFARGWVFGKVGRNLCWITRSAKASTSNFVTGNNEFAEAECANVGLRALKGFDSSELVLVFFSGTANFAKFLDGFQPSQRLQAWACSIGNPN
jgi:hypothetical protein